MLRCFCDSLCKLIELRAFVEESFCTRTEVALAIGGSRVATEDHKSNVWRRIADSAQNLQARAAVELNVQHDHIGVTRQDAINRALGRFGVAHHGDVTDRQQAADSLANRRRIVSKKNLQAERRWGSLWHASTVAAWGYQANRRQLKKTPSHVLKTASVDTVTD